LPLAVMLTQPAGSQPGDRLTRRQVGSDRTLTDPPNDIATADGCQTRGRADRKGLRPAGTGNPRTGKRIIASPQPRCPGVYPAFKKRRTLLSGGTMQIIETQELVPSCHRPEIVETSELQPTCHS